MKIEIDTKHDSPEEIKKVIKMLQHLVGQNSYTNKPNIFEDSETPTETGNAFANMFGDTSKATKKEEPMEEPKEEKTEEKEEIPEVIPY